MKIKHAIKNGKRVATAESEKPLEIKLPPIENILSLIILIFLVVSIITLNSLTNRLNIASGQLEESLAPVNKEFEKLEELAELAKPPIVELIKINMSSCSECDDLSGLMQSFEATLDVKSTKEMDYTSAEAKTLIVKYSITKLPTILVRGETEKITKFIANWNDFGTIEEDKTMVVRNLEPVYFDLTENKAKGLVTITEINNSLCKNCAKIYAVDTLTKYGIKLGERNIYEIRDDEAKELIREYNIKKAPTFILSNEIKEYPEILANLEGLGSLEKDGTYVFRSANPVYYDLEKQKAVGVVKLIVIKDSSCSECFDASVYKQLFGQFGLTSVESETYDSDNANGIYYIENYQLKKLPAAILTGELDVYEGLTNQWGKVGTVEADGSYVFRELDLISGISYLDLETGKVVTP